MNKLIVFDLDGTLNQTENYAVPAMLAVLKDFGVDCFHEQDIMDTFGAKDEDTIEKFFGEDAYKYNEIYWDRVTEYINEKYIGRYKPYSGVKKMLKWLKREGYKLAVCSNADINYITNTLSLLKIESYFDDIQPLLPGKSKIDSLRCLLKRIEPDEAVMVGDRYFDLEAAKANQLPFVACLYGYGKLDEFEGADELISCPMDLVLYLKKKDKPPCRVLVLDLDNTLLNSKKEITSYTKEVLIRFMDMGGCIVLASGRPTYGIIPVAEALQLNKRGGYILSYNGGCITDCRTGEVIYQQVLDRDDVKTLAKQAKLYHVNMITYEGSRIITENDQDIYSIKESRITKMQIKKVASFEEYVDFPLVKCLMTAEPEYLEQVEIKLKQYWGERLSICRSEPFFLEVTAKGIDKAKSLKRLLHILHLDKLNMIACGDGFNDQTMIEYAGFGVAMGNAQSTVKDVADYIAPSSDENGVAYVMEYLMPQEENVS